MDTVGQSNKRKGRPNYPVEFKQPLATAACELGVSVSKLARQHGACAGRQVRRHLPLYRQSVIYARGGVDLDRALLASWVGAASALLRPLVDAIRKHVLAAQKLHADDTPVPVLAPSNGKTKTGRPWTYVRDDRPAGDVSPPLVWFAYSPDRKGIHPQTHLARFEGVLQADAYAGFNALYEAGGIEEAACWAHARRKFHDLHVARPSPLTTEALRRIAELYLIKAEIRGKPPDERRSVWQTRARPLLDNLEQ